MEEVFEIAKLIEENEKAEAQAVVDYTELLKQSFASNISEDEKDTIGNVIEEIVADELNHQQRLHQLYSFLTGIEAKKE